ncbi:hypothetical protein [Nocardia asteroides]|uniref:hypothetical protein n=1 Tax=Nocardia asteroides TaxID=1824 RepID=UPI001E654779|nr:hypothetical protein [Nocardia asteroides]UGT56952.1 hypothetical protein LTT85_08935 [Nocardia asteroides]
MARQPKITLGAAAAAFLGAIGALVAADAMLDDRKRELLATRCAKTVDVPGAAVLLNSLGAGLLIGTAVLLIAVAVSVARTTSRWKPIGLLAAGIAFIVVGLYAALVTFATVSPGSNEPASPEYHPCAARI